MVIIKRTSVVQKPPNFKRVLGLKEFYEKRHKVLVIRGVGGLGDILMHRMMFEDFKLLSPETEIHFACPWQYHDAIQDHPFIDRVLGVEEFQRDDYILSYNTTTACGRYEMQMAPYSGEHRSDIWATHCGIKLTRHNMHFRLTDEEKSEGKRLIEKYRFCDGPSVLIAPISAMPNKNLTDQQLIELVTGLRKRGLYPFGLHTCSIYPFLQNDLPTICKPKLRQWLGIVNQADYVISVDSAAFHCAGGMGKPLVGVFTFVNASTYSRYYSTALCVQGPCPYGYTGCYNWGMCKDKGAIKPCLSDITAEMILAKVDLMLRKWPI